MTSGGLDTLVSIFLGDADPSTVTNPNATDSDQDGITDGKEDLNHNGRADSGEANPTLWDTDRDGLPDGHELAGWIVGVWYERTMEKKENRSVTSDLQAGPPRQGRKPKLAHRRVSPVTSRRNASGQRVLPGTHSPMAAYSAILAVPRVAGSPFFSRPSK